MQYYIFIFGHTYGLAMSTVKSVLPFEILNNYFLPHNIALNPKQCENL